MLLNKDKTPRDFVLDKTPLKEKIKKFVRKFFYPMLTSYRVIPLEKKYKLKENLNLDMILLGHKGSDYEAHRRRVNKYKHLKKTTILLIGIGTGRDLESWLKYNPKKIISIDYFNYQKAWDMRKTEFSKKYNTELEFIQADILDMHMIKNNSIDIIGSDAVFEHINKFDKAIVELYRVLKKDGLLYATFGPLWYAWGGDHISGRENLANGYNHIKLSKKDYEKYLECFGEFNHKEEDGRTWIRNNLFSYLKPIEYLDKIQIAGFIKKYSSVILEPRAILYQNKNKNDFSVLENKYGYDNLIITGMTIIYKK